MTACHCPNQCPDCQFAHPVASMTHDHRIAVHGHACEERPPS